MLGKRCDTPTKIGVYDICKPLWQIKVNVVLRKGGLEVIDKLLEVEKKG